MHGCPGGAERAVREVQARASGCVQRAVRQRLLLSGGPGGELARPGVQQHPHLHGRAGVADGVGEALGGDLLGFGQGRRVTEHVGRLVDLLAVLGRLTADQHLDGAAQPPQADLQGLPVRLGQPGTDRPAAHAVARRRAEEEHVLPAAELVPAADQEPVRGRAERRQGDPRRLRRLDRLADQPPRAARPGVGKVRRRVPGAGRAAALDDPGAVDVQAVLAGPGHVVGDGHGVQDGPVPALVADQQHGQRRGLRHRQEQPGPRVLRPGAAECPGVPGGHGTVPGLGERDVAGALQDVQRLAGQVPGGPGLCLPVLLAQPGPGEVAGLPAEQVLLAGPDPDERRAERACRGGLDLPELLARVSGLAGSGPAGMRRADAAMVAAGIPGTCGSHWRTASWQARP